MGEGKQGKMCVFGSFDDSELYSRTRVLIDALDFHCSSVIEVRPQSKSRLGNNHRRVSSFLRLIQTAAYSIRDFFSFFRQRACLKSADFYYIPYPAYLDYFYLRLLTRGDGKKVVVDGFLCLHDTLVHDRKMVSPQGCLSRIIRWIERSVLSGADLVFIDTSRQREVLLKQYNLEEKSIVALPVGIDESVWGPAPRLQLGDEFTVLFWGTFIPLHGIDTIIRSAHILQKTFPQIKFRLIGDGQTAPDVLTLIEQLNVTNVSWRHSLVPARELRSCLDSSHCVLGIFGESEKGGNVIPYKAYQAMACNKILISRSGPAILELLDGQNDPGLLLVPPADPEALALMIVSVFESYRDISESVNTRKLYDLGLSNAIIKKRIAAAVEAL